MVGLGLRCALPGWDRAFQCGVLRKATSWLRSVRDGTIEGTSIRWGQQLRASTTFYRAGATGHSDRVTAGDPHVQ